MKGIRNFFPLIVVAAVPASVWAAEAPSEPNGCGSYMMWGGGGPGMMWSGGWPGMIFGPLSMLLMLGVVIAAVVLLVRWGGTPGHGAASMYYPPAGRTPVDILKERFARGEIDKNEFEERRRLLGD